MDLIMKLSGKRIAELVADGFEQSEMAEPRKALEKEGAKVACGGYRIKKNVLDRGGYSAYFVSEC